jgi:hypothetical protein
VQRTQNLVELDLLARRYGTRPSALLGVEGWLGYQLDLAVAMGSLASQDERRGVNPLPTGGFKAPSRVRKMKIPENGVW